jgi:hypothetical protein
MAAVTERSYDEETGKTRVSIPSVRAAVINAGVFFASGKEPSDTRYGDVRAVTA